MAQYFRDKSKVVKNAYIKKDTGGKKKVNMKLEYSTTKYVYVFLKNLRYVCIIICISLLSTW